PRLQGQIVDSLLERDDPAIEQGLWLNELPPEIVDDEYATKGFYMERRIVEIGNLVVAKIQHFQRELAPRDDEGPTAGDPAAIEIAPADLDVRAARLALDLLVHGAVENLDDLAFDLDAVRDVDNVRKQPADPFCDRALAVAWRTVEQEGATGIDRR